MKAFVVALVALWMCATAHAQALPQLADGKVTGAGFVVTLPPDVTVEIGTTPESDHGFYIELPTQAAPKDAPLLRPRAGRITSYRYIAFDTKWDIGDMPSLDAVVDNISSNLLDSIPTHLVNAGDISLDGNYPARLGTLSARRLVIKYKNTEKKPAIRQVIVAYNARKDASGIVYLLVLNTTQQNFQEDVSVFSKVLAGFKLTGQ